MQIPRLARCLSFVLLMLALAAPSFAGVSVSVSIAPPALPVYEQPPCPGDGYIWTPGYWAYGPDGYFFWVPGTWVLRPAGRQVGQATKSKTPRRWK
jgi:YXWGXW repeat-containing protein